MFEITICQFREEGDRLVRGEDTSLSVPTSVDEMHCMDMADLREVKGLLVEQFELLGMLIGGIDGGIDQLMFTGTRLGPSEKAEMERAVFGSFAYRGESYIRRTSPYSPYGAPIRYNVVDDAEEE